MKYDQLSELEKIANQLTSGDAMNPDPMPQPGEEDVAALQAENALLQEELAAAQAEEEALNAEEAAIAQSVQAGVIPGGEQVEGELPPEEQAELMGEQAAQMEEQVAEAITFELLKHANEMYELGTIAKLLECARGEQGEELEKSAHEVIAYMVSDSNNYYPTLEKIALELFPDDDAAAPLFTVEALDYIDEKLAYLNDDELEKTADETSGLFTNLKVMAGSAIQNTRDKVVDAAKAVTELGEIKGQIGQAEAELEATRNALNSGLVPDIDIPGVLQQRNHLQGNLQNLHGRQTMGRAVAGGLAGAAIGGAAYGGHKLYDHFNQPPTDEMLLHEKVSGTLDTEYGKNGGMNQMSQKLVYDFMKIAGAAGLVSIANNPNADFGLRKEASDQLDIISTLGRSDMDAALVKVATEIYPENELHEIVAGYHTPALMDKVAYFLYANEASIDELEKTANAGGVAAAKNIGAGLADAASNIENTIASEKSQAEGAGREYIGNVNNGSGKVGGGLVGGTEGYNVTNNPGKYDVEQTASLLEEAYLAKQAAAQAFVQADDFIKSILG